MASQSNLSSPILNKTSVMIDCHFTKFSHYHLPSYTAVFGLLIFPLYFLVLHTGFQRWRKNKGCIVSHTDFFTYHNVFFELIYFCGFCVNCCASHLFNDHFLELGKKLVRFSFPGLLSHHVLTCVERYLAVVYPVVYMSLKKKQWIWARNVVIFAIWVLCILFAFVLDIVLDHTITSLCLSGIVTSVTIFSNVHALCALRNPSPGERGKVSKSKCKAFNTMLAILSTLMLWFTLSVIFHVAEKIDILEPEVLCAFHLSHDWFQLPSSLVLPLLFLHRAEKLPKCQGKKIKNPGLELKG